MEGLAALNISAFSDVTGWLAGITMSALAPTPLLPAEQLILSGH
jgi:hypothetical protein